MTEAVMERAAGTEERIVVPPRRPLLAAAIMSYFSSRFHRYATLPRSTNSDAVIAIHAQGTWM